jgi:hypothetical protein
VARWSSADKEKATGFPSILFRTMSVSLGREVCWFFFSDALDMELALRQSTGGGVSVCLDPAHLPEHAWADVLLHLFVAVTRLSADRACSVLRMDRRSQ